ncbi:hypothetical protein D1AOALGA4SA_7647 [Olavius algarvensis Delta 1 endosymbiont]|nr:hypothetical protein D1AOALGA4SA_7647 [Olavius algarvensis Delta 1 endosymbiont]
MKTAPTIYIRPVYGFSLFFDYTGCFLAGLRRAQPNRGRACMKLPISMDLTDNAVAGFIP